MAAGLIEELKNIVGPRGWMSNESDLEPHLTEWRGAVRGRTPIMVMPRNTEQVAEIVKTCAAHGAGIVPQGGNTGTCGGAVPDGSGEQILLNLSRLNRIRNIDAADFSMVAEAGCILATLQAAALEVGRYFPLSLAAEGSCQIGGNLSTNAGGLNVIRYGTARNLVLGLEVVLADGTVWDGLRTLRKDTAGYDMKQVFIGSEGTLGVITAAALRLFPMPGETTTALLALDSPARAIELLSMIQEAFPERIQSFELVSGLCFALVEKHIPDSRLPFGEPHPWYVLLEVEVGAGGDALESALMNCLEIGFAVDAIVAKNEAETRHFWHLRHSIADAEKREGVDVKHDLSVPIAGLAQFLEQGEERLRQAVPEAELVVFGHVGDGNLHYNANLPDDMDERTRTEKASHVTQTVYDLVAELGGSFSAEHGVGQFKKSHLLRYRDTVEIQLMRTLKTALDPRGIMNPGKVL